MVPALKSAGIVDRLRSCGRPAVFPIPARTASGPPPDPGRRHSRDPRSTDLSEVPEPVGWPLTHRQIEPQLAGAVLQREWGVGKFERGAILGREEAAADIVHEPRRGGITP